MAGKPSQGRRFGGLRLIASRCRFVAPVMAALMVTSQLVTPPMPVQARSLNRPAPGGARATAPSQPAGTATGRTHVTTARSTSATAPGLPVRMEAPEVPGAVGPERRFAPVSLPAAAPVGQVTALEMRSPAAEDDGYVEGASVELVERRTSRSTTFANPDGTKTVRFFDEVAFVPDEGSRRLANAGLALTPGEQLQPVDTTLRPMPGGRLAPVRAAPVSFGARASDEALIRAELDGGAQVSFSIDGAGGGAPVVDGPTAVYASAYPEADVHLTATAGGVKEEIVLHSTDAPTSWLFPMATRGVTPSLHDESGSVVFTDAAGVVRGHIPPGFMVDSNVHHRRGEGERSNDVTYSLMERGDAWVLRVDLDETWLRAPARETYRFPR